MQNKALKKTLSLLLALVLLFAALPVAFAAEETHPILVVSGMGSRPMTDHDSGKTVFPPATDTILKGVFQALGPVLATLLLQNGRLFDKYGADAVHGMLAALACDEDGNSVQTIDSELFPDSVDHYRDVFADQTVNENGFVRSAAETVGWENTYFFNYDWRMNPLDIAEDLHEMVNFIYEKHHTDISMIALSMGGNVTMAYLSKFGSEHLRTVVLASTAFLGVEMVGRMLAGDLTVTADAVLNYFVPFFASLNLGTLSTIFAKLEAGAAKTGTPLTNQYLSNLVNALRDPLYQKVFRDTFARFLGVWSFVPAEFYADARALVTTYTTVSDSFLAKTQALQDVQAAAPKLIDKARSSGTNVYIVGAYGFAGIPITKGANNHTDNLIDTHLMTGNCAVAPYGKTLADVDYDRTGACGNKSHFHVSTDGVIDAGVGMLPDQTWVIKGMSHVEFGYDHESTDLALWLLTSDKPLNILSDERFPQFTELDRETGKLVSLTQSIKDLSAEDGEIAECEIIEVPTLPQRIAAFFRGIIERIQAFLFPKVV